MYWNSSSFCVIPDILGIEYGIRTKLPFDFLKSDTIRTIPFGFCMMNVRLAQAPQDAFSENSDLSYNVFLCTEFPWMYSFRQITSNII